MHGLINRTIQVFTLETYGAETWRSVAQAADIGHEDFEAMLLYEDDITLDLIEALGKQLNTPSDAVLEDIGTFLVSHRSSERVRRLLRFGGNTFVTFLHSLEELPERIRLAVDDLDLPEMALNEHATGLFCLTIWTHLSGWADVLLGMLRALADDYGALVLLERKPTNAGCEKLEITLVEAAFAEGRGFELAEVSR